MSSELLSLPESSSQPLELLAEWGFSESVIARYRDAGRTILLPLQVRALARTGLLAGESLVVSAVPSSGKTFVAELAAVRQWALGMRTVFLVPTKALAEELYASLKAMYQPLSVRVVIATRERRLHDDAILAGKFDFAVMVYEKFRAFLTSAPEILEGIGLVVADELQILDDAERGDLVDLLLTQIVMSEAPVQILALSGVLSDAPQIAEWLRAQTLIFDERPLELREGVYCHPTRTFMWREVNSGREGEEVISDHQYLPVMEEVESVARRPERDASCYLPAALELVQYLTKRQEQVLLFVPTRRETRLWAKSLGEALGLSACTTALDRLAFVEPTQARFALEESLRHGVGFHNSDLPLELRRIVEDEVRAARLQVLVSTSTLAEGVNLSVQNVVQVPRAFHQCFYGHSTGYVPLKRRSFRNQGNRAARLGDRTSVSYGRSILLADDPYEAYRMMRFYLLNEVEPLRPEYDIPQLLSMSFALLAAGLVSTREQLCAYLGQTYTVRSAHESTRVDLPERVRDVWQLLEERGLIEPADLGSRLTAAARAGAAHGAPPRSVAFFQSWCTEQAEAEKGGDRTPGQIHELELLAVCAYEPDGFGFALGIGGAGSPWSPKKLDPEAMARSYGWNLFEALPRIRGCLLSPSGVTPEAAVTLRKAVFAHGWTSGISNGELEATHHVDIATLAALGQHLSWRLHTLASVAEAVGVGQATVARITGLARRAVAGLPPEGESLGWLECPGVSRTQFLALIADGYSRLSLLAEADPTALAKHLPEPAAAELVSAAQALLATRPQLARVAEKLRGGAAGEHNRRANAPAPDKTAARELRLHAARPGRCTFRGSEVELDTLVFRLLVTLAQSPNEVVGRADLIQSVWNHDNVARQQLHRVREYLVKALAAVCGPEEADALIETIPSHGYRLRLHPAAVDCRGVLPPLAL